MNAETGAPKDELDVETKAWLKGIGLAYGKMSEVIAAGPCPKVNKLFSTWEWFVTFIIINQVLKTIEAGIIRANKKAISNAQKVQKFKLLEHDFSVPTGELGKPTWITIQIRFLLMTFLLITGPTLKLKRNVVVEMYKNVIEEMYKE